VLWLVGTPIGNLKDLSERAREVLEKSELILCEDTRHSTLLLKHFGIKKRVMSYHKFNEKNRLEEILEKLREGQEIALISNAGMPCLADPGEQLVRRCREEGLLISTVPGPCAALLALVLSGFPTAPFQFVGFLEKREGALIKQLLSLLHYGGTSIAYESPHRIQKTLKKIQSMAPEIPLFIARELTKLFEEGLVGTATSLLEKESIKKPRGEFVLVFAPSPLSKKFETLSAKEHVALLESEFGLSFRDALKLAASLRKIPKKNVQSRA